MVPIISFLIGSGFSIPAGLPSVKEINERFKSINYDNIVIPSNHEAFFVNEETDRNFNAFLDDRIYFQEFLYFYLNEVIKEPSKFNYEVFYDFLSNYPSDNENKIKKFDQNFNNKFNIGKIFRIPCQKRIFDFKNTYNYLLLSLFDRKNFLSPYINSGYEKYYSFIFFLSEILKKRPIKVHSLNHDLLLDWLFKYHPALSTYFCDGFQFENSRFYGKVESTNTDIDKTEDNLVKLEYFSNKFDNKLCLLKLHGSILNYAVRTPEPDDIIHRIKYRSGLNDYVYKKDSNSNPKSISSSRLPDFLTGTQTKLKSYNNDYYKILFGHFKNNLLLSNLLIVIGYGFQDSEINNYLEKNYLSYNRLMIVINPIKPKTDLIDKYKTIYIHRSITEIPIKEFLSFLPDEIKNSL